MRNPPYPSDLTDEQWSLLRPLIPPAAENCRPRKTDLREVANAIFYLNRSGCPWRMLPRDFPPWRTVYNGCDLSSALEIRGKTHHVFRKCS